MPDPAAFHLGDEVELRKAHACGANHWIIVRTGVDVRVQCAQCGRYVLMPRPQFNKAVRSLLRTKKDT